MRAPLVVAVVWLAGGLAVGLQWPVPPGDGPLFVAAALASAAAALALARGGRRAGRGARGASLPILLFGLVGALLGSTIRADAARSCVQWIPDDVPLEIRATILSVAAANATGARSLRLRIDTVGLGGARVACGSDVPARWEPAGGDVTAAAVLAGARVRGRARWWSPPGSRSMLGRPGTLLVDTLGAVPTAGAATGVTAVGGSAGMLAARLRGAGVDRIDAVFPRHPELVASLLLARRDRLDREVRDRYARAGLSHLLAISGLHVGLIAGILLLLAGALRVSRPRAAALAAVGTVGYVALLGAPHSAARAALQIVLVLSARAFQRPSRTESLIATAALVLLVADPSAVARPGFQLSFAGVAGILALRGPLLARLGRLARLRVAGKPVGRWLADGLATSLAATLATAPIVAWHFGRVAPIGIVANLLAIPLLGLAVPALTLALTVGVVSVPAGRFLAGGGELLLDALDHTATLAASVPAGTVAVLPASAVALTAAVAAGYGLSRRLGRVRGAVRYAVWMAVAVAVLLLAPLRPAGDRVEVHLIDVGQGDAIGLRSPGGRWLLVDAGVASERYDAGARRVVPYLTARGVRRLDGLVISHPDGDHMGGAGAAVRSLRPRWAGGPALAAGKPQYLALLRETTAAGIPWVAVRRGMELELDGMTVSILYPGDTDVEVEDANDGSVVMRVTYGAFAVLLTGDAPASVEERLVRRFGGGLDADVLKVGHHGSSTSTTRALLAATGARVALISAGRGNRYGHPAAEVLARLRHGEIDVYRTDRHGSVVVRGSADGTVRIETERETRRERGRSPG